MMVFDGHNAFITASYAMTGLILIGATIWVVLDHRAQEKALSSLERDAARDPNDGRQT